MFSCDYCYQTDDIVGIVTNFECKLKTCTRLRCKDGCKFTCKECGKETTDESLMVVRKSDEEIVCDKCCDPAIGSYPMSWWEVQDSVCAYVMDDYTYCGKSIHSCYGEYCSEHAKAPEQGCDECNNPLNKKRNLFPSAACAAGEFGLHDCCIKKLCGEGCNYVCFDCHKLYNIHEVRKISEHSRIFMCKGCIADGTPTYQIEHWVGSTHYGSESVDLV